MVIHTDFAAVEKKIFKSMLEEKSMKTYKIMVEIKLVKESYEEAVTEMEVILDINMDDETGITGYTIMEDWEPNENIGIN